MKVIYILIIILVICLAFLLFDNYQIYKTCQITLINVARQDKYLFIDDKQYDCLPNEYKVQIDQLLSELNNCPIKTELTGRLLILIDTKLERVIGILEVFKIKENEYILSRVLKKESLNNENIFDIVSKDPWYIANVIIDKNYRGTGRGAELFHLLFENLNKEKDIENNRTFLLEVDKKNNPAIQLYKNQGFVSIGQSSKEYLFRLELQKIPD